MVDIIKPAKKNIIMDATILSSLMSCARLTDFRFNHNLVSMNGKSNSLEVGSIVHKVLEVYFKCMINGFKREDAIGTGLIAGQLYIQGCPGCATVVDSKPTCGHEPHEYPGVKNTPMESTNEKGFTRIGWQWALDTCEQYFDFYRNDFWVPLEVEVVKRAVLYEDDDLRIMWKGKIDLCVDTNQAILPVDHKTSKQRRSFLKLNNQFMGYARLMNVNNIVRDSIGFQTTLKPEEKFTRNYVSYSDDSLLEWQQEILPYYGYLLLDYTENNLWPPNYTHCENKYGNCIFYKVCENNRNMREETIKELFVVGPDWNPENEDDD